MPLLSESQSFTGDANEDLMMVSTPDYFTDIGLYCEKSTVRKFVAYVLPPIYWSVFFLGLFGNALIIVIYTNYGRLKTMTDTYLINLAIADILFLMTLPFWAISASHEWIFYTIPCKIVNSMYTITVYSGMLLLACISVDRYIAIVQATKAQKYRTRSIILSKLISLSVWIFAVVLSIPEIFFSTVKEGLSFKLCTMSYPIELSKTLKVIVIALKVTIAFCIPLLVMMLSYALIIPTLIHARSFQKHKALKVIFAVLSVFVLSQLPYNSVLLVRVLDASNTTVSDCATSQNIDIAYRITQSIAFIHCCLNPFIYVFVGVKFRNDLFKLFSKFSCISESKSGARINPNNHTKLPGLSEILETKMGTLSL